MAGGAAEGHPQHAAPLDYAAQRGVPGKGIHHQAHAYGGGGGELRCRWFCPDNECWRGGRHFFLARCG